MSLEHISDLQFVVCHTEKQGWRWLIPYEKPKKKHDTALIYVHGYANTMGDAMSAYYTAYNHVKKMPVDGYGFLWGSEGRITAYLKDLKRTKKTTDELLSFIYELRKMGYDRIVINAHSMGAHLVMESLKYLDEINAIMDKIDMIALLGADCIRWKFREKNSYGKTSKYVRKLFNYYSTRDNVLRFVSKLIRPLQKIGNHKMPKHSPKNYLAVNAGKKFGRKIRHNDYKDVADLQQDVVKKALNIVVVKNGNG